MKYFSFSRNAASLFLALSIFVPGSASAAGDTFGAALSGAQEVPAVDTSASGNIIVKFDAGFSRLAVNLKVKDLVGSLTGVHLHCARPGANGPVAFGLINPGPLTFDGKRVRGT